MNSKDKKKILKKYTGKGGHYSAADLRQINQNDMMKPKIDMSKASGPMKVLGGMAKRVAGDVVGGVKKAAYNTFVAPTVRFNKAQKERDDMFRKEGEALKSGAKMGVLKKAVKAPVAPKSMPLADQLPKKLPKMMPKKVAPMGAPLLDKKPKVK